MNEVFIKVTKLKTIVLRIILCLFVCLCALIAELAFSCRKLHLTFSVSFILNG